MCLPGQVSTQINNIDLALSLQEPEHRHFVSRTASALAFAVTAEVALVDLDLARQQLVRLSRQGVENHLTQLVVEQDRGVAVDPRNLRCRFKLP